MTFVQRQINVQFSKGSTVLSLNGLRARVLISNWGGFNSTPQVQLRAYGMTLEQMNQYTSTGSNLVALNDIDITISAGDVGKPVTQIFHGSLVTGFIDTAGMPEINLTCTAIAAYREKGTPVSPNSYSSSHNAEDIITAIAGSIGFSVINNGAHAVLQDQYLYGSGIEQIVSVCRAAPFPFDIVGNTIYLWPNNGARDNFIVSMSPENGLVGYPTYFEAGLIVKTLFNPEIQIGRQVNLTSSLTKTNGTHFIIQATHELSSMEPDGPWFTTATLVSSPPYVAPN